MQINTSYKYSQHERGFYVYVLRHYSLNRNTVCAIKLGKIDNSYIFFFMKKIIGKYNYENLSS